MLNNFQDTNFLKVRKFILDNPINKLFRNNIVYYKC